MIYKYALTEYKGLTAKSNLGGPIQFGIRHSENHEERDPNQLRYVCHQLYQETNGLGIRLNSLDFYDTWQYSQPNVYEHFCHALSLCSARNFTQLRRITLVDHKSMPPTAHQRSFRIRHSFSSVEQICRGHPHITVIIRFSWEVHQILYNYFSCLNELSLSLSRKTPLSPYPELLKNGVSYLPMPSYLGSGHPVNLRFTPTRQFPEQIVLRKLSCMFVGERLHEVVKGARQLHEDGM